MQLELSPRVCTYGALWYTCACMVSHGKHMCMLGIPWHMCVHACCIVARVCECTESPSTCVCMRGVPWYIYVHSRHPLAHVCACMVHCGTCVCRHGTPWHTCVHAMCPVGTQAHVCTPMSVRGLLPAPVSAGTMSPPGHRVSHHTPQVRAHVFPLAASTLQQRLLTQREPSAPQPLLWAPGHGQAACSICDGTGAPAVSPWQPCGNRGWGDLGAHTPGLRDGVST